MPMQQPSKLNLVTIALAACLGSPFRTTGMAFHCRTLQHCLETWVGHGKNEVPAQKISAGSCTARKDAAVSRLLHSAGWSTGRSFIMMARNYCVMTSRYSKAILRKLKSRMKPLSLAGQKGSLFSLINLKPDFPP